MGNPMDVYWEDRSAQRHVHLWMTVLFLFFFLFQQPNFKQKFVALLKRFKVTDEVSDRMIIDTRGVVTMFNVDADDLRHSPPPGICPSPMKLLVNRL